MQKLGTRYLWLIAMFGMVLAAIYWVSAEPPLFNRLLGRGQPSMAPPQSYKVAKHIRRVNPALLSPAANSQLRSPDQTPPQSAQLAEQRPPPTTAEHVAR